MLSVPHMEFLPGWCSSELSILEEDANLEYDSFVAAGCILDSVSSSDPVHLMNCRFGLITSNMPRASYAHQRTSLLVKIIANLHCFVPEICNGQSLDCKCYNSSTDLAVSSIIFLTSKYDFRFNHRGGRSLPQQFP